MFDFTLPAELEADSPPEARGLRRDQVRLLVTYREKDGVIHARFSDLPGFLRAGDLVVVNNSATLPAALRARRSEVARPPLPAGSAGVSPAGDEGRANPGPAGDHTRWRGSPAPVATPLHPPTLSAAACDSGAEAHTPGRLPFAESSSGEVRLHLSTHVQGDLWIVEPRQAQVGGGEVLVLPDGGSLTLLAPAGDPPRLWYARLSLPAPILEYLHRWGKPIAYPYVRGEWPLDMYQTIFATEPGSAEMPSAGRPFTPEVVAALAAAGVSLATITLHTGVASLERHEPPYAEWFSVPRETVAAVEQTRQAGGRVIAAGTTVIRALESAAAGRGRVIASRGWTDLIVTPERGVSVVDGLLTGLHEPRASHLALLAAIGGEAHVRKAYRAALDGRYLWHEFGDAHLIL